MIGDSRLEMLTVGRGDSRFLYTLLLERDIPTVGISHTRIPQYEEHLQFVRSLPYLDWCIVWKIEDTLSYRVGAVYLSPENELGIQIAKEYHGRGYGEWAVRQMIARHPEVMSFRANINPRNTPSLALFAKLGFLDLQVTLQWQRPGDPHDQNDRPEDADPAG